MRVAHDEIVVGPHPRDVAPNDATTAYTRFILKEGTLGRLVMVSNRVGSSLKSNQGGLATALVASLGKREVLWFGWSGEVTDGVPAATEVQSEGRLTRMLVDLERNDYEGYYTGFANRVRDRRDASLRGSLLKKPYRAGELRRQVHELLSDAA